MVLLKVELVWLDDDSGNFAPVERRKKAEAGIALFAIVGVSHDTSMFFGPNSF